MNSVNYILLEGEELCGYARCRNYDGYSVYIYDFLVDKKHRGKEYGQMIIEQISKDFANNTVYVMSDVDIYYEKLGYKKKGTIFIAKS